MCASVWTVFGAGGAWRLSGPGADSSHILVQCDRNNRYAVRINYYCHLQGVDETSSVAYNLAETQTLNYYFFLLLGREDSAEILASVWQEPRKLLKF